MALDEVPFGTNAITLVGSPSGVIFGRAGYGPWYVLADANAWSRVAATGSAQQGPIVPLSDGSLRMLGGAGNPTCAAVASVLGWQIAAP